MSKPPGVAFPKFGRKYTSPHGLTLRDVESPLLAPPPPPRRETSRHASLNPAQIGTKPASPSPARSYSGSALGIATMHKSNAVPVWSREEAEEIAHMRRS